MKLGLDFDNTLVCYDQLFYRLAREEALIEAETPANKTAVRDRLRAIGREPDWTRLQGLAYGPRIIEAQAFEGLQACLRSWQTQGWDLAIVSHKTRTPYAGESHDLHASARAWLETHLQSQGLLNEAPAYFELTRQAKLERIASLGFDAYVDDLPDILIDIGTSVGRRLLFDPHDQYPDHPAYERWLGWQSLERLSP